MEKSGTENLSKLKKNEINLIDYNVEQLCKKRFVDHSDKKIIKEALRKKIRNFFTPIIDGEDFFSSDSKNEGMPLMDYCRNLIHIKDFSVKKFEYVLKIAKLWDSLKKSNNPPIAFIPNIFLIDESNKRVSVPKPLLELFCVNPKSPRLSSFQKNFCAPFMHQDIIKGLSKISIESAMNYSFTLFLLDAFYELKGRSSRELIGKIKKFQPCRKGINPSVSVIFKRALNCSIIDTPTKSSEELLRNILVEMENSPFNINEDLRTGLKHNIKARCDSGKNKKNSQMEDSHYVFPGNSETPVSFIFVADGVSTADIGSGGCASRAVLDVFETKFRKEFLEIKENLKKINDNSWISIGEKFLRKFFDECSTKIVNQINELCKMSKFNKGAATMCSTITAAIINRDQALIGYLGDSPAVLYQSTRNILAKLSTDHNLGMEKSYNEPNSDDDAHLTRYLGDCEFNENENEYLAKKLNPEFLKIQLFPDDILFISSDGLIDCADGINEDQKFRSIEVGLKKALSKGESMNEITEFLIANANAGTAHDNITVAIVKIDEEKKNG